MEIILLNYLIKIWNILSWPKCSFKVFHKTLQKNTNQHFGQPNILHNIIFPNIKRESMLRYALKYHSSDSVNLKFIIISTSIDNTESCLFIGI